MGITDGQVLRCGVDLVPGGVLGFASAHPSRARLLAERMVQTHRAMPWASPSHSSVRTSIFRSDVEGEATVVTAIVPSSAPASEKSLAPTARIANVSVRASLDGATT
jgi:hypothetical protein